MILSYCSISEHHFHRPAPLKVVGGIQPTLGYEREQDYALGKHHLSSPDGLTSQPSQVLGAPSVCLVPRKRSGYHQERSDYQQEISDKQQ